MCVVAKMSYIFVFLLGGVACVKAAVTCPFPDYALCGNDGHTYKNICEWQLAQLLNPSLTLLHFGLCKESPYGLYQALIQGNGNGNMLRSKHRKNRKNKRLSSSSSGPGDNDYGDDFIQRLADMQFNFRREQEEDEEQEED